MTEEAKSSNKTSNIPHEIEENEFFHGLLPKEDLCFLFANDGDFAIRASETAHHLPIEIIISVQTCKSPLEIKHFVVHRTQHKDVKWTYFIDDREKYDSLKELIDDFMKKKRPLHPEVSKAYLNYFQLTFFENFVEIQKLAEKMKATILVHGIGLMPWEFRHSDIDLKERLGEGQYGDVFLGEIVAGPLKRKVAIKMPQRVDKDTTKGVIKEMMHEARIMRIFDHPNIVRCVGVAVFKEPLMIVLELVNGGSLYGYLRKEQGNIPLEEKISNMCYETAKGLEYLHAQNCIHRDIASRNILYTDNKIAKISDFGLSRIGTQYSMRRGKKIPLKWTAPETIAAMIYTLKSDVFSYSVLLWEIYTDGEEPYEGMTVMEVRQRVCCGSRLDKPEKCPKEIYTLMCRCWEQNPDNRMAMKDVVAYLADIADKSKCSIKSIRRKKKANISVRDSTRTKANVSKMVCEKDLYEGLTDAKVAHKSAKKNDEKQVFALNNNHPTMYEKKVDIFGYVGEQKPTVEEDADSSDICQKVAKLQKEIRKLRSENKRLLRDHGDHRAKSKLPADVKDSKNKGSLRQKTKHADRTDTKQSEFKEGDRSEKPIKEDEKTAGGGDDHGKAKEVDKLGSRRKRNKKTADTDDNQLKSKDVDQSGSRRKRNKKAADRIDNAAGSKEVDQLGSQRKRNKETTDGGDNPTKSKDFNQSESRRKRKKKAADKIDNAGGSKEVDQPESQVKLSKETTDGGDHPVKSKDADQTISGRKRIKDLADSIAIAMGSKEVEQPESQPTTNPLSKEDDKKTDPMSASSRSSRKKKSDPKDETMKKISKNQDSTKKNTKLKLRDDE